MSPKFSLSRRYVLSISKRILSGVNAGMAGSSLSCVFAGSRSSVRGRSGGGLACRLSCGLSLLLHLPEQLHVVPQGHQAAADPLEIHLPAGLELLVRVDEPLQGGDGCVDRLPTEGGLA